MGPDLSRTAAPARVGPALKVWARVIGGAAAARVLPVWAGVVVIAAVLFGGNGMRATSLTVQALASPGFGVGLALTWLALIVPAGRAMLDPSATAWLRALPIPRGARATVTGAIAVAAQVPWAVLWFAGAGPVGGAIATVGAAAAMLAVAELAGRVRWPHRTPRWRTPFGGLLAAHRRLLARAGGAALARGVGIAWLGGASAGLVTRASGLDAVEARWWTLAVATVALPIAIGAVAQRVVDSDRRLDWTLRAAGCSWSARVLAAATVLACFGAALGVLAALGCLLVSGASVAGATLADAAALIGAVALFGAGLGGLALRAGTWAADRDDGTRVVLGMAAASVSSFVAIAVLGAPGVLAIIAAGVAAAGSLADRRELPEVR